MEQHEHIQELKRKSEIGAAIQRCYEKYLIDDDNAAFEELMSLLDRYCRGRVRSILASSVADVEDVMQEARLNIFETIVKDRHSGYKNSSFSSLAFIIYRNKAIDFIRANQQHINSIGLETIDENILQGENVAGESPDGPEATLDKKAKKDFYDSFYRTYCVALTESEEPPSHSLALFFARMLPHMLQVNHNEETIPNTKATSAKWAYERMGNRTVGVLSESAERDLKAMVDQKLIWCDAHNHQLNSIVHTIDGPIMLRGVIYTVQFKKHDVDHWAERMHGKVIIEACRRLFKTPGQKELAVEYVSERDKLYRFIERRGDR